MAETLVNLTADGTTLIGSLDQLSPNIPSRVGIHAHGSFGGGTLTFQYSFDGGTTNATLKDGPGTSASDISYTAPGGFTWDSPLATGGTAISVYAVLTGATSPDIDVRLINQNAG